MLCAPINAASRDVRISELDGSASLTFAMFALAKILSELEVNRTACNPTLPPTSGVVFRAKLTVYESLERAFQRIRGGEYPPDFPSDIRDRKKRQALKLAA
jgi:hypothetical protein